MDKSRDHVPGGESGGRQEEAPGAIEREKEKKEMLQPALQTGGALAPAPETEDELVETGGAKEALAAGSGRKSLALGQAGKRGRGRKPERRRRKRIVLVALALLV